MHRTTPALILFCLAVITLSSSGWAQTTPAKSQPVLDVTSMDTSVDPCVDFFTYSCGTWIKENPIPADLYRANGVVSNMPEFQQAFHCKAGSPMLRENRCRVW